MRRSTTMGLWLISAITAFLLSACGDENRNFRTNLGKMELPDYEDPKNPGSGDSNPNKPPIGNVKPSALNWDGSTYGDGTYNVLETE